MGLGRSLTSDPPEYETVVAYRTEYGCSC